MNHSYITHTVTAGEVTAKLVLVYLEVGNRPVVIHYLHVFNSTKHFNRSVVGFRKKEDTLYPLALGYDTTGGGGATFISDIGYRVENCDRLEANVHGTLTANEIISFKIGYEAL